MPQRFKKVSIKPDVYFPRGPDGKPVRTEITAERVQHWAAETKRLLGTGANIPVPYVHTDDAVPILPDDPPPTSYNNAGHLIDIAVAKDGSLECLVEAATDADAERLGNSVKDVSLRARDWMDGKGRVYKDVITHLAAVNHPVWSGQPNFVPHEGIALSLWMSDPPESPSTGQKEPRGDETGGNKLETCLELLAEHGFELPDDTDEFNFLDHLRAALIAVKSYKAKEGGEEQLDNPPAGSKKQQPSPIAMATDQELQFALETLGPGTNPATNKPWTADELKAAAAAKKEPAVQLSLGQQAQLAAAQKLAKQSLVGRIENLIATKRVDPVFAQDHLIPLLNTTEVKFSLEGDIDASTPIHTILDALENSQPGSAIDGHDSVSLRGKTVTSQGQQFSLGDGLKVHKRPSDLDQRDNQMTDEEADELAKAMLASVGQ